MTEQLKIPVVQHLQELTRCVVTCTYTCTIFKLTCSSKLHPVDDILISAHRPYDTSYPLRQHTRISQAFVSNIRAKVLLAFRFAICIGNAMGEPDVCGNGHLSIAIY